MEHLMASSNDNDLPPIGYKPRRNPYKMTRPQLLLLAAVFVGATIIAFGYPEWRPFIGLPT
jgi:hypothetical protein